MHSMQNKISAVNRFYLSLEDGGFALGGASKEELPVVGSAQDQIFWWALMLWKRVLPVLGPSVLIYGTWNWADL